MVAIAGGRLPCTRQNETAQGDGVRPLLRLEGEVEFVAAATNLGREGGLGVVSGRDPRAAEGPCIVLVVSRRIVDAHAVGPDLGSLDRSDVGQLIFLF